MKRWKPFHYQIPLTEGEVPMDKGGFRTAIRNDSYSALEAVVYCKDCKHYLLPDGESRGECMARAGWFPVDADWFCADGEKKDG